MRVYWRRQGKGEWERIQEPKPGSQVGRFLQYPDQVWEDGYGNAYKFTEEQ